MSFFKKLFGSSQDDKVYKSSDNVGTTYSDHNKVDAAWQAQGMMFGKGAKVHMTTNTPEGVIEKDIVSKGRPFICYTYDNEQAAREGMSSLSFIKTASDTHEFISLETLEFGCYETETKGTWEIILWGDSLTPDLFKECDTKLSAAGGKKKGERKPAAQTSADKPKPVKVVKPTYLRTDQQGPNTYEVYKAPSKASALEFLKTKTVTRGLYYVVIETPEGNWGKDKDGIYQE